jgi:hypothetical protein
MARFFLLLGCIGFLVCGFPGVTLAMGLSDFVAVADSPTTAVYNLAGLVNLEDKDILLEHCIDGRNIALGTDDLVVYSVAEQVGTGALFFGYSQDLLSGSYYSRNYNIGYAYGWRPTKEIALGLSAKFGKYGIYNDYAGDMAEEYSNSSFMIDAGVLVQTSTRTKLGFAVHNIGSNSSNEALNYQSTLGFAYQASGLTAACEIYDLFDEGGGAIEGSLGRIGLRYAIVPDFKIHAIIEESIGDWNFSGKMLGLEFTINQVTVMTSWHQADGDYLSVDSWQATMGYHF